MLQKTIQNLFRLFWLKININADKITNIFLTT